MSADDADQERGGVVTRFVLFPFGDGGHSCQGQSGLAQVLALDLVPVACHGGEGDGRSARAGGDALVELPALREVGVDPAALVGCDPDGSDDGLGGRLVLWLEDVGLGAGAWVGVELALGVVFVVFGLVDGGALFVRHPAGDGGDRQEDAVPLFFGGLGDRWRADEPEIELVRQDAEEEPSEDDAGVLGLALLVAGEEEGDAQELFLPLADDLPSALGVDLEHDVLPVFLGLAHVAADDLDSDGLVLDLELEDVVEPLFSESPRGRVAKPEVEVFVLVDLGVLLCGYRAGGDECQQRHRTLLVTDDPCALTVSKVWVLTNPT